MTFFSGSTAIVPTIRANAIININLCMFAIVECTIETELFRFEQNDTGPIHYVELRPRIIYFDFE